MHFCSWPEVRALVAPTSAGCNLTLSNRPSVTLLSDLVESLPSSALLDGLVTEGARPSHIRADTFLQLQTPGELAPWHVPASRAHPMVSTPRGIYPRPRLKTGA
jgi:hypothetical protein